MNHKFHIAVRMLLKILMSSIILTIVCKTCLGYETDKTHITNATSPWSEINDFAADTLREGVDVIRVLWKECSSKVFGGNYTNINSKHVEMLLKCAKKKTLKALDRILDTNSISLGPGIQLVKYETLNDKHKDDGNGKFRSNFVDDDWTDIVLEKLENVFNTHVLKLNFNDILNESEVVESRHRRRHQMMHMMMFGMMTLGMILIPMGFQFLAVIGGKALLLAKIAMVLSSIQGLKKIATSPVNYGLYQYDSRMEKRGIGQTEWKSLLPISKHIDNDSQEKIKYVYDSESRLWKPEIPKKLTSKRSLFNLPAGRNVYTVYPIPPQEYGNILTSQSIYETSGVGDSSGVADDQNYAPFSDIHAEYSVEIPVKSL